MKNQLKLMPILFLNLNSNLRKKYARLEFKKVSRLSREGRVASAVLHR